jgi:tetratricopeptide (TPR) repeat protein
LVSPFDKSPNKSGNYTVSIAIETLTYWWRLDTPVLVVLYASKENAIFARWAQSYDLYDSRAKEPKSVTFKFGESERYTADSFAATIPRELRLIRALRERAAKLPLLLSLELPHQLHGREQAELSAWLKLAIRQTPHQIKFGDNGDGLKLSLQPESVKLSMPGNVASATLHVEKDAYANSEQVTKLAGDAMLVIASFLLRLGLVKQAAELVVRHAENSHIYDSPQMVDALLQAFVAEDLLRECWQLIKPIYGSSDATLSGVTDVNLGKIMLHDRGGNLGRQDHHEIAEALKRRATEPQGAGLASPGNLMYTAAKVYQGIDEHDSAIAALLQAGDIDPGYLQRAYYHEELAGLLFVQGRFEEAAASYQRALEAGDEPPETAFLLSDALMKAGRYGEAAAVEINLDSLPDDFRSGANLLKQVRTTVLVVVGVESQDRSPLPSGIDSSPDELSSPESVLALLRDYDALNARLWYRLALLQDNELDGFKCMLAAAWFEEDSATAWVLAMMLGIQAGCDEQLLDDICSAAFRFCEREMLSALDEVTSSIPIDHAQLRQLVYRHAERPRPQATRVIRIHDPQGSGYQVIDLNNEEGQAALEVIRFLSTIPPEYLEMLSTDAEED